MTGRAIIIVVVGIIVVAGIVLYNIEASSTGIVANLNKHYSRQFATNIAASGVNMALTKLAADRTWRAGFSSLRLMNGTVTVTVYDTVFAGIAYNCVGIRSVAIFNRDTSIVATTGYFPPKLQPITVKGLLTLNGTNQSDGNITLDGRDHDLSGAVIANSGTYGVWTTGSSFTPGGSTSIGGTAGGVDFVPSGTPNPAVVALNQPAQGYFSSIDSAFGGTPKGYPPGTMMALAKSGVAGSQYVTDPTKLKYPLGGVTYVDLPAGGSWNSPKFRGSGIVIVHNSAGNALLNNPSGKFSGILLADDMVHLHLDVLGAVISFTKTPSGNVVGNGNASILYSNAAILNATSMLVNGAALKVVAWWE